MTYAIKQQCRYNGVLQSTNSGVCTAQQIGRVQF